MELQLQKQPLQCLRTAVRELQSQEQTQEIRLSDGMPDIGSIIRVWGQVILRSKEWETDTIRVSGGTMVWVAYRSEDGEETACMESWLPFQMQWSHPQGEHDGRILCQSFLKSVDARSTSARKMMLRTSVALLTEGLEPCQYEIFSPESVPEDVQILTQQYPVQLPVEAGEKAFTMDEMLSLPAENPGIGRLISYRLQPEVTEEKLMGDKLVFRGKACLRIHYIAEEGMQHSWETDIPFSQFCELDGEYEQSEAVRIWPCVTALEVELQQEQIHLKAGLVCQYRICSCPVLEIVTDAYSNFRNVNCNRQTLDLPVILESKSRRVTAKMNCEGEGIRLADIQFLLHPVSVHTQNGNVEMTLSGQFQPLCYGAEGELHSTDQQWTEKVSVPMDENAVMEATAWPVGTAKADLMSGSGQMQTQLDLHMETRCSAGIPVVSALELEEPKEPDPNRPSLILKRAGDKTLWELAKENGSTVERIQIANHLQGEPEEDRMLLIPVV